MRKITFTHNKLFVSLISVLILISSTNANHIINEEIKNTKHINNYVRSDACEILKQMRKQYIVKVEPVEKIIIKEEDLFLISAYDLSYQSCQKSRGNSEYGITASGFNLKGHTLQSARVISVDPSIIPLGSKVRLTFKENEYKRYNGIYKALDVGGRIKGHRIDLFYGDFNSSKPNRKTISFGLAHAIVTILND